MAASDISLGAAVKLRGSISDLLTKAQAAAATVTAALATIAGSTQVAAQASVAATSSKDSAASSAAAAATSAATITTAAAVVQAKLDAANTSATGAAASATGAGTSAAAAAASLAALIASKGTAGGVAALDSSAKLLAANLDFASTGTVTTGTDTAKPVNSAGVQAALSALAATIGTSLAGKLAASLVGVANGVAALNSSTKLLSAYYDFASSGTVTTGTDTTQPVNSAGVQAAITALINGSPGALNTLKELADALGDDANFATTITTALASKLASAALGAANGAGSLDGSGKQPIAQAPTGTSVADPGTGKLEALLPIQTITAASRTFVAADLYKETRRSNAGAAMTDTFPASTLTGLTNGTMMQVNNVDGTASLTVTAGSGTTVNGGATAVIGPGRSTKWVYDAPAANWRTTMNSLSAVLANQIGAAGGVSGLDSGAAVPLANLRIRRAQFLKALEALAAGNNDTLLAAIPANAGDPKSIAYYHDWVVEAGGTLANLVQTTFSLTNTQMTALFAAAALQGN